MVFVCSLVLCVSAQSQGRASRRQLKVISFNVRTATADKGSVHHWDKRKDAAAALIAKEDPTVFGVQEAILSQVNDMKERLPEYEFIGVGRKDGGVKDEIMGIFWKKADVELLDWGTFWLSETPSEVSKGWDSKFYRSATWAVFRHKPSGRRFFFLNTHLDHIAKVAREESIKLICQKMEELNPKNYPAFVTADFNSDTSDMIFEPLKAVMRNAREYAPLTDDLPTFNRWGSGSPRTLDYIFVSGSWKLLQYRTIQDDCGVPYVSDHYPVSALIQFR